MKISALTKCKSLLNNSSHFNKLLEVYDKNGKSVLKLTSEMLRKQQLNLPTALALQSTKKTAILKRQEKFYIAQTSPKRKTFLRNITSVLNLRDSMGFYRFNPFNMTPLVYLIRNPFHRAAVSSSEGAKRNKKSGIPSSPSSHTQQSDDHYDVTNFNQRQMKQSTNSSRTSNSNNQHEISKQQHSHSSNPTPHSGGVVTFISFLIDHLHATISYFCSKLLPTQQQQICGSSHDIQQQGSSAASSCDVTTDTSSPEVLMSSDVYVISAIVTTMLAFCLRYLKLITI